MHSPFLPRPAAIIIMLVLACPFTGWAESELGPLQVKNQFPPHLMFLTPLPESPKLLPQGKFQVSAGVDYSSVFVDESSRNWTALIDMEMLALRLSATYGLWDRVNLSLHGVWISMNSGFLDGFLEEYHNAFGFPNYGRERRPKNEFAYYLRKNGQDWFRPQSGGVYFADSTAEAKFALLEEKQTGFFTGSLAYTVKLPTGDYERGYGSGRADHGLFLLTQSRVSSFVIHFSPGVILLTDPVTLGPAVPVRNLYSAVLGLEYLLNDSWNLLAQLNYYRSPFGDTGIKQLDDDSLELAVGFTCRLTPQTGLEFAFCEDLSNSAPDFNVHLRVNFTSELIEF
ncbi:MAG: DUF3187 family protein [Deltaproteobacteria bacterium]|nr:DUF3187 family protein [Deltaproteobacteria bacterium]